MHDGRVFFGAVPGSNDREVETIDSLTKLVNNHWSEIESGHGPVARVAGYARLAAFLRWADEAQVNGHLGGIDFTDLAAVPANDRKRFPTPDALRR